MNAQDNQVGLLRGVPGLLQDDLGFYGDEPYRDYQPQFGIEQEDEQTFWITDHGRRVALIDKKLHQIDLFEFQPGQPRLSNPRKPPVYHAPTLLGARLTLVQWVGRMGRTSETWDLTIHASEDRVALTATETWQELRIDSIKRLEVRVHARFGYVISTADTFQSAEPVAMEMYNFLVQGLTHHQPAKWRFPLVVWHSPSRGLLKWASNLVSLRCAGHQDRAFARNLGRNGWLGFFGEPDWNPILALGESSGPCTMATCDNLLDEHFCFAPSPNAAPGAYVLTCRGMMLVLPGGVADRLIERAAFNDLLTGPTELLSRMRPFCLNKLCDFETPVAIDAHFRGDYWSVAENSDDWASVSDERAHSGRWALRLRVRPADGERSLSPQGSSLWLDAGRSYRLSAYVCFAGNAAGQFALCVSQAYFTFIENREPKAARCVAAGSIHWQRLEVTFTVLPNDPCAFVQLVAAGDGKWFVDDLLLEEMATGRPA